MQHLMSLRLRPLLYAAAAAVTAAGVYYYIKKRDDGEKTAEHAHTSLSQEAVQGLCAGSDLLHDGDGGTVSQTASGVTAEDSLNEAEEKNQKDEVSGAVGDSERSNLEDRVRELEKLLCEAHRACKINTKVSLAEAGKRCESCALLQNETSRLLSYVAILQGSVKEKEQELCEVYRKLGTITLESQATLADVEQKYEQVMKTDAELKQENANLISDLDVLQDYVCQMELKLSEAQSRNSTLITEHKHDLEAYSALKVQYNQMEETFNEELLKASLANSDEKYELQIASFAQLQSDLMAQVNSLQASVQQLEEELRESRRKCDEMTRNGRI